jgi:hypothetical protein
MLEFLDRRVAQQRLRIYWNQYQVLVSNKFLLVRRHLLHLLLDSESPSDPTYSGRL